MSNDLRIGFLGAGLIATYHSKSLRRSGVEATHGVVRAGVYDPDPERAWFHAVGAPFCIGMVAGEGKGSPPRPSQRVLLEPACPQAGRENAVA